MLRSTRETADHLGAPIKAYRVKWGVRRVALVGFCLGANVLPDAYLRLRPEARRTVAAITLLTPATEIDREITVSD